MFATFSDFLSPAYPEIFLLGSIFFLFIIGLIKLEKSLKYVEVLTLLVVFLTAMVLVLLPYPYNVHAFNGAFVNDFFSYTAKGFILFLSLLLFLVIPYSKKIDGFKSFEYIIIALFSIFAMMVMCSSIDFISSFVALELLSLCMYVLVALNRNNKESSQSAMKFFIYGSISSAFLLFGISFLYGITGSTHFDSIATDLQTATAQGIDMSFAFIGLVFILCAFAFKLALAPLHFWLPDVLTGLSLPVIAFLMTLPKFSEYILLSRILWQAVPTLKIYWSSILIGFGVFSLIFGTLGALLEKRFKRFLGYTSTANIGYVLISFAQCTEVGVAAAGLYLALYSFTVFVFLTCVIYLESMGQCLEFLDDFKGLFKKKTTISFLLVCCLLSFAGIPFFPGFFTKVYVIYSPIYLEAYWLVGIILISSLVAVGYYFRIINNIISDYSLSDFLSEKVYHSSVLKLLVIFCLVIFFGVLFFINEAIYVTHEASVSLIH